MDIKNRNKVFLATIVVSLLVGTSTFSREKVSINSGWDFVLNDSPARPSPANLLKWQRINLPHTWNALDILDETVGYHRGIGWYRRLLLVEKEKQGKSIRLYFEGACIKTTVYINGKQAGIHQGGYTGFIIDATRFIKYGEENLIEVRVDNSQHLSASIPPVSSDFNQMGGIYRDVWMIITNQVYFEHPEHGGFGIDFKTPEVNGEKAGFVVKAYLQGIKKHFNGSISYSVTAPSGKVLTGNFPLKNFNKNTFEWEGAVIMPQLWSPENPSLYTLEVKLLNDQRQELDVISQSVGFKWAGIGPDQAFMLNGKPYKLRGASRHQDYDRLGFALTDAMHLRDMELMKEMGCNFIRIAHYPQDPAIFNACDKLGLISWCEIPVVDKVNPGEAFNRNTEVMMHEMIVQNRNHPSIAIWGYHNEVRNLDTASIRNAQMLNSIAKTMDPDRLTAIAFESNIDLPYFKNPLFQQMSEIADINGYNVYQGWYRGKHEDIRSFLDTLHNFAPQKPILLSEYGAGSIINIHTHQPTLFDFSEEYQCAFHEAYVKAGNEVPWMTGFAIWNFIDFQRDGREDVVPNINKKGLVTTDRRKKDAFYFYKSQWSKDPFVYLTGKHWPERIAFVGAAQQSYLFPLVVYSNQPQLELYQNGKRLGDPRSEKGRYEWMVSVPEGSTQWICRTPDGSISDVLPISYTLIDTTSMAANMPHMPMRFNTGQSRTFFTDTRSAEIWMPDKAYQPRSWGYVGGSIWSSWPSAAWNGIREGIHRPIRNTINEPLFQTFIQGLTAWRADVPEGKFRVTLLLSEPFTDRQRNNEDRKMNITLNGELWAAQLNLANEYGIQSAVMLDKEILIKDGMGISIRFEALSGSTLLNGVMIEKLE
jgi:beta-galactosidase